MIAHFLVVTAAFGANFIEIEPASLTFNPDGANARIDITAMSGDGKIIAGQSWTPFRAIDCSFSSCGISSFEWSVDDASVRQFTSTQVTFNTGAFQVYGHPYLIGDLSQDGSKSLLMAENRDQDTVIDHGGQVTYLRPIVDHVWLLGAGMSADASVVVGNLGTQVVRWTLPNGIQLISGLPDGLPFTAAGVSGDGNVALLNAQRGFTQSPTVLDVADPRGNAYTWTVANGAKELSQISGDAYSHAVAASFDGSTVVGNSVTINSQNYFLDRAVKWTNGALTPLQALAGYNWSTPRDVSANGQLIVGIAYNQAPTLFPGPLPDPENVVPRDTLSYTSGYSKAVIWDAGGTVFDLQGYLSTHYGLANPLQGWQLLDATSISDDGLVIAGRGIDPQGVSSLWVAELGVPEPSSIVELSMLLFGMALQQSLRGRTPSRPSA